MKKLLAIFVLLLVSAAVISAVVITTNAFAEETTPLGSNLTITGNSLNNGNDYEYKYVDSEYGYILTIKSDKQMTISGNTPVDRIVVNSQNGANLIFSDLFVDTSVRGDLAAFDIDAGITNKDAVIKVTLKNGTDNTLKSKLHAGLQKSSDVCTLIIDGTGSLTATGGDNSAGIGGGNGGDGSNITIKSGTIEAIGGTGGAGIGGGNGGSGSNIQIYGGTIAATTLSGGGAGIGGGNGGNGEKIYIHNCVSVTAKGESGGAGIGGGYQGYGNDIQIEKGTYIEATGSGDSTGYGGGAGIGGGSNGNGTNITISGGDDIIAKSGPGSAGIGGGSNGSGSEIEISGSAVVKAESGNGGAGIGGGGGSSGSGIEISGNADVTAISGGNGAGIGGGANGNGTNITISGGKVKATGGFYGAGIGGGANGGSGTNIIINGGEIYANGGSDGAGIGGGNGGSGSGITISGGSVEAIGVDNGAGIGGGNSGNGSGITIKGSAKVTATGGYRGAGIGGGYKGDGSNIIIGDNSDSAADIANRVVIAKSEGAFEGQDGNGAGIGGGGAGNGDTITIYNGIVTAESDLGAGIGGGGVTEADASNRGGNGTNITINGGNITATSNCGGAGIGGGQQGGCGNGIFINDGTVTATSKGDTDNGGNGCGAGIGGGSSNTTYSYKGNGENIIIKGGIVTATGTGAGIGGGGGGDGIGITISDDAEVEATGATKDGFGGSAGIGGGNDGGAGTDITISGNAKVTAASLQNGASIGGGSSGIGTNITIKDNADVTVNNNGCAVCIGSCTSGASKIDILGGTVTAKDTTEGNTNNTTQFGIGGMAALPVIEISGGAKVSVAASAVAIGSTGSGSVTINGAEVTAVGNIVGINCNSITISGDDTQVIAEGGSLGIGSFMNSANCTVTITGGKVTAVNTAGGTGIGGAGSTVDIKGTNSTNSTNSTSYPWVFTNKITSENGNDEYWGIVFEDENGNSFADIENNNFNTGIVYGRDKTVELTEPYTLNAGKTLRVQGSKKSDSGEVIQKGAILKTENKLELAGTLYIEAGATLDKYYRLTLTPTGEIQHEDPSPYGADSTGKIVCDICGKEEPHNWKEEWVNTNPNHHWHECDPGTDCSVFENNKVGTCSITDNSKKDGYGVHVYNFDNPTREEGMLKYECTVCGYAYSVPIPVVYLFKTDENDEPLVGAEFGIYSDAACQTKIADATTAIDADKNNQAAISYETVPDKTLYIKETKAPVGYAVSYTVYKAVVGADGTITYGTVGSDVTLAAPLVCKNAKDTQAQAKIIKTDDKGAALAGAVFGIYSDPDSDTPTATATTAMDNDEASVTNGKAIVSFTIEFDNTYYIKEITAPVGYTASDKVYKVKVDADGKITYGTVDSAETSENIPVCENKKSAASDTPVPDDTPSDSVKIIKVDSATKNPLAGAQFGLYSDEDCTVLITTKTTAIGADNKAVVSFDIEPNKTYYIKEIKAPEGYTASDEVFKAVVDADGKVTYGVVGSADTSENIPVCKNERSAADTSVPSATPNGVNNPETGVVLGTAGTAILSGIICVIASKGAHRRRKRKNGDNNKIDF